MSGLFMLSLQVKLRELRQIARVHGFGGDEGRMLHHALSETFGKGAVQPFRLLPGRNSSPHATLYGYTSCDEQSLRQTARETAPPDLAAMLSIDGLQIRSMPDDWAEGRRLAFDLRVRPVRRLHTDLPAEPAHYRKGAEVDAFLVHCGRSGIAGTVTGRDALMLREAVYREWLQERLAGATLDPARTRMVRFDCATSMHARSGARAPDAIFHGELTVIDGAAFGQTLGRGVGRHAAYGFGMLLLRPTRSD